MISSYFPTGSSGATRPILSPAQYESDENYSHGWGHGRQSIQEGTTSYFCLDEEEGGNMGYGGEDPIYEEISIVAQFQPNVHSKHKPVTPTSNRVSQNRSTTPSRNPKASMSNASKTPNAGNKSNKPTDPTLTFTPTLSQRSKVIMTSTQSQGLDVTERLARKQLEYIQRQQQRVQQKEESLRKETTGTPTINSRSKSITGRAPVEERLTRKPTHSQSFSLQREATIDRDGTTCTFTPAINSKSQNLHRTLDHIEAWTQQRDMNREMTRNYKAAAEHQGTDASCKGTPTINEISRRIVETIRSDAGSSYERVEHRLLKKTS
eukprot:PhF_6_TR10408/c0_g1_i1/m.16314